MVNALEIERTEEEFEELLNDTYEEVSICGMMMQQGSILREVDPIAFRCGMADEPIRWECEKCGTEYEEEDEAEECCKDDIEEEEVKKDGKNNRD